MVILRYFLLLILVVAPFSSFAQPNLLVSSGKTQARIATADGMINFYSGTDLLSFQYKSFLTVKVGIKLYTNNDQPPTGTTALPLSTQTKEGDTVSNAWSVSGATFVQRVFPKMTKNGRKIGVRFNATNAGADSVSVACQYLLDVQVGGSDGSPVLYRDDYLESQNKKYASEIPSYFAVIQNGLPNAPTYDPGLIAMAIYQDELSPSIPPSLVVAGHWPDLERLAYLTPEYVVKPSTANMDRSILAQWPEQTIDDDSMHVIGEFAYGVADHFVCTGWLFALIFRPDALNESMLLPDRTLEMPVYLFNPDLLKEYKSTVTVNVEGALRLKGMEQYSNLTTYPPYSYKHFSLPLILDSTSNSLSAKISITGAPAVFTDTCASTIGLIKDLVDNTPPMITVPSRPHGSSDCANRRDTVRVVDAGSGLTSIDLDLNGYSARYLSDSTFPGSSYSLELTVLDTLLVNASATIRATDQSGNFSLLDLTYCPIADTLPPRFYITFDGKDAFEVIVTETRPWDQLLDRIDHRNEANMYVTQLTDPSNKDSTWLNVKIIDPSRPSSICLQAWDNANNRADTCLAMNPIASVRSEVMEDIRLSPNPANEKVTIHGSIADKIRIIDILGKEVNKVSWLDTRTIDLRELPIGHYLFTMGETTIPFTIER